jgi:hypothetical protein
MSNVVCDKLGVRYPILHGPMIAGYWRVAPQGLEAK